MKKTALFTIPILSFLIYKGCAPTPTTLSEIDPAMLIANADSLLSRRPNDLELRTAIVTARLNLAKTENNKDHYQAVLKIDPRNATANYHIHMSEGKAHHSRNHKNGQWDAIQSFSKAGVAIDSLGEPYYWLGRAYEKKDEMDFELPLEAYETALSRYLTEEMKPRVSSARSALLNRKKIYEDFWK